MSPQVSFFMLPEEAIAFLQEQTEHGATIVDNESGTNAAQAITVERARQLQHIGQPRFYILEPSCDVSSVRMAKFERDGKPRWFVDELRSRVVQVDMTFFGPKEVAPGRLYFVPSYFDGSSAKTQKPESTRAWAARVMKGLRRRLTKIPGELVYASSPVYDQAARGEIVLMIGAIPAPAPPMRS